MKYKPKKMQLTKETVLSLTTKSGVRAGETCENACMVKQTSEGTVCGTVCGPCSKCGPYQV